MERKPLPFKKILFVCTNSREPGERVCCAWNGSLDLHADLKQWVKDQGLQRYVRVCKSGCMDRCEAGPNLLVMPDNAWFSGLDAAGLAGIKASLLEEFGESPDVAPPA